MKNFVISLNSAMARRHHIHTEFSQKNLAYEFFDAITPEQARALIQQYYPDIDYSKISAGELACLVSHLSVWLKALEQECDYVAIFEDDIFLADEASHYLSTDDWLPSNVHTLKIETFHEQVLLKPGQQCSLGRQLFELKSPHFGAAGYIISKQAIRELLQFILQQAVLKPLDHILFADFIESNPCKTYQLVPALCIQEKVLHKEVLLESTLDLYRHDFRPLKEKKSFKQKLLREVLRIVHKIRLMLFARKVAFK